MRPSVMGCIFSFIELWQRISWDHLKDLFTKDSTRVSGLKLLLEVKKEHVQLSSYSRMRVDLAAHVSFFLFYCWLYIQTVCSGSQ